MKIPNVVTVVFYWFISLESLVGGSCVPEIPQNNPLLLSNTKK